MGKEDIEQGIQIRIYTTFVSLLFSSSLPSFSQFLNYFSFPLNRLESYQFYPQKKKISEKLLMPMDAIIFWVFVSKNGFYFILFFWRFS